MTLRKPLALLTLACVTILLAGCSSPSVPAPASAPTTTVAPTTTTTTVAPTATTTTGVATTENLVATLSVQTALVAAGAALNHLPASDYTGLIPGRTYYAYDATTTTYWAAAGLLPSPSSTAAEVSTQDDGAYLLFSRPANGTWTAVNDGLGGAEDSSCPVAVPAVVLTIWNWAPGTCYPPG
jgi:hypothetical protein